MATRLGNVAVGTVLKMQENGVPAQYIVIQQGLPSSLYDSSCNGTWLLRRYVYPGTSTIWQNAGDELDYSKSLLNNVTQSVLSAYDAETLNTIYTVKIPYCYNMGGVKSGSSGMSTKIFVLSPHEYCDPNSSRYGVDGAALSWFSGVSGSDLVSRAVCGAEYWGRSTPFAEYGSQFPRVTEDGFSTASWYLYSAFARPCIIRPSSLLVDDDGNILNVFYPDPPASITVPTSPVPTGSAVSVSWSSVSNAESYQLQRSSNGGSWQTIYTGSGTSYSDVAGNWTQVQYRVASVTMGITSGYATSTTVTILPYVVESFTTPSQVMQGQTIPLSWTASAAANTYILQRNVNGGGWTQIYSGGNTSYTDTPQSNWTTVQYRVQAGANGSYGAYATSASIPVISASALVISGTDGDLGTLTADVPYTVSSDTGNPITLERYVNGQLVATTTVESGFAYSIPVMDLPSGAGSIKISATVQASSGPVSASRNWTYTKTAITFPATGGVAQLSLNGQNVFPPTLAESVRVPSAWGGTLDLALQLLLPLVGAAVISVGTYTGTGTFGQDNPNTLEFPTPPTVVTIYGAGQTLAISSTETSGTAYISGNTATWYSETSAADQLNSQGVTYSYVAVRKAATT